MEPLQSAFNKQTTVKPWKPFKPVPNAHYIAESIQDIPEYITLTPLQDKQPKRKNWNTEPPLPREVITDLIINGEKATSKRTGLEYTRFWSGYGIRTGDISDGLITFDIDGKTALPLLLAIMGVDELPHTVSWTSGKPGRLQLAFQIPARYRDALKHFTRRTITEFEGLKTLHNKEGKPIELLEIRYNTVQSALPPSRHPETGQYKWINSFNDTAVLEALEKVCQFLLNLEEKERKCDEEKERIKKERLLQQQKRKEEHKHSGKSPSVIEFLKSEVLPKLDAEQIYNWSGHNFRAFGNTLKGAPPWRTSQSGTSFHVWWDGEKWAWTDKAENSGGDAVNYRYRLKGGTGYPEGKNFIAIVKELAADAGLQMPAFESERDEFEYKEYLKRREERRLIYENEDEYREEQHKENLCNYIKGKIRKHQERRLKRLNNWKKQAEKNGEKTPVVQHLVYDPEKEFPLFDVYKDTGLKIKFRKEQRIEVVVKAIKAGWKLTLDSSFMGTGKSHDSGLFFLGDGDNENSENEYPEDDGTDNEKVGTFWYLDKNHTNPSTETVEVNTVNMMPRNDGMKYIEGKVTPLGTPHLRHTKEGEIPDVYGNCKKAKVFNAFQQKGYDPNAPENKITIKGRNGKQTTISKICNDCSEKKHCHILSGNNFGYRGERKEIFEQPRIRASIESLPGDYDYRKDVAFIDEASSYLRGIQSVTATESDLANASLKLERANPQAFNVVKPFIYVLQDAFKGEFRQIIRGKNRGADHDALMSKFPSAAELLKLSEKDEEEAQIAKQELLNSIIIAVTPKLEEVLENGDSVTTLENIKNLPPNILGDLFAIWLGIKKGALRVNGKKLTVTTIDRKHSEILSQMRFVNLLDATGDKNHLAKVLNVDPNHILEIEQETPDLSNLQVVNINLKGMGSRNISEQCKELQKTFVDYMKEKHGDTNVKVLTYKTDTHIEKNGHWFHDNRATNTFLGTQFLIVFNSPRMNLGVAQDEYRTLYGSLDGFEEYYRNLMKDEVIQLIGRQRAHLNPDCNYIIYLVGTNQDVSYLTEKFGIRVINKEMIEVCPEAAAPADQTLKMIFNVSSQLFKEGNNLAQVTCQRVADAIGKSKQLVSKTIKKAFGSWSEFKACLLDLLNIYRSGGQVEDWRSQWKIVRDEDNPDAVTRVDVDDLDDSTMQELEWLAHTYLPLAVKDEPPDALLEQIGVFWSSYGEFRFSKLITFLSSDLRQEIVKTMLFALGADFSTEILAEFNEGIP